MEDRFSGYTLFFCFTIYCLEDPCSYDRLFPPQVAQTSSGLVSIHNKLRRIMCTLMLIGFKRSIRSTLQSHNLTECINYGVNLVKRKRLSLTRLIRVLKGVQLRKIKRRPTKLKCFMKLDKARKRAIGPRQLGSRCGGISNNVINTSKIIWKTTRRIQYR
ncbi:unnamed protein product [Lupinus luteus]|uniref:Uncharacterized protein n=1 Tax=Lupinus luteus TaxID=3873 RepID=A0AAV1XFC0_LUPLU